MVIFRVILGGGQVARRCMWLDRRRLGSRRRGSGYNTRRTSLSGGKFKLWLKQRRHSIFLCYYVLGLSDTEIHLFYPFSRQQRLWMSSSLKNELFRHRRVRSLEMDIQYEDRVTAEIENFLREQLVMMCVIITLETWALLTELGARQRVKASATTKTFCTLVNFRLWFLQRISLVCIDLQGPST